MGAESAADRAAFLDTEGFGVTVTVTDTGETFNAIFDKPYVPALQAGVGFDVESDAPELVCRTADVTANSLAEDTTLTIEGASYKVVSHRPDGTGMSRVLLADG